ncbi:hypothetical protein [Hymenobacter glacieicola]|uniref:Uncharacterized protein n=1 Tax=Hymenobacter glacieicola TaxID=1562124 RepID=A0ABQ1WQT8_9BACT|nr:hypothetical protein [Hymenobacter glacieicola]GGG39805.1 hypothetical protein GCM10011378_15090 [Hymenobacter glacieicola]
MPAVSTRPGRRARLAVHVSILLVALGLTAGCRSSHSAYQFRPAPAVAHGRAPLPDSGAVAAPLAPGTEQAVPARVASRRAASRPRPVARKLRLQMPRAVAASVGRARQAVAHVRPGAQAARHSAAPRRVTEVGLGTTVLGVLGLVVLPVALLGLLIWGGPVWAILAGLAALAVLVAYLDPFA